MVNLFQQILPQQQKQQPMDLSMMPAELVSARRQMAERLLNEAGDTAPVQHWTQAAARAMGGAVGAMGAYNADQMAMKRAQAVSGKGKADDAAAAEALLGLYPGGDEGAAAPQPAQQEGAPDPEAFVQNRTAMAQRLAQNMDPQAALPQVASTIGAPQPQPQAPQAPATPPQLQGMPTRGQIRALLANPSTRQIGVKLLQDIQQRMMPPDQMQQLDMDYKRAQIDKLRQEASGHGAPAEMPMNVREWEYFNKLPPDQQSQYLNMKRSIPYLNQGTQFSKPDPVTGQPMNTLPIDNAGKEMAKGYGQDVAKTRAELPEAKARLGMVTGALDRLEQTAQGLALQPGLDNVVGGLYQAYTPNVTEKSLNASTELDNLKVKISGVVLQTMRDMSKTGGAVGQVTEREWPRLENMISNLDPKQGKDQFMRNLNEVVAYTRQVKSMLQQAYEADVAKVQGSGMPSIGGAGGDGWTEINGVRIREKR